MKRLRCILQFASALLLVSALYAQDSDSNRRQDETRWAKATGIPADTVHRLWRSISHFADEKDDDSQILALDTKSLASRDQLLMVTAAGLPTCLAVTIFLKSAGYRMVWSESQTPDGRGFCENFGLEPEVNVKEGKILVKAPGDLLSKHASDVEIAEYIYVWTGKTYMFGRKETSIQFVPAVRRPN